MNKLQVGRYRLYQEHRYHAGFINDTTRLIGRTDFSDDAAVNFIKEKIKLVIRFLEDHCEHEEKAIHVLLDAKNSKVHKKFIEIHGKYNEVFDSWNKALSNISSATGKDRKIYLGYIFYLEFRKFEAEELIHLYEEEGEILAELQALYSDEELRGTQEESYKLMNHSELVLMLKSLFPHTNADDHFTFLHDIKLFTPEKFIDTFSGLVQQKNSDGSPTVTKEEVKSLCKKLEITESDLKDVDLEAVNYKWLENQDGDRIVKSKYEREEEGKK